MFALNRMDKIIFPRFMRGIYMLILTSFVLVGLFCAPAFAQQNQAQQTNKRPESLADISKKDETRRDKYISNTQNIDDAFLTQTQPAENILPQPTKPVEREALLSLMSAQIIEKLTGNRKTSRTNSGTRLHKFWMACQFFNNLRTHKR